jgi:hypothetical protein
MAGTIPQLPFDTIRIQLETVFIAVGNKLEREWPRKWSAYPEAAVVLRGTIAVTENTYHTVRILCADPHPHPSVRREFVVSVPPLARTVLDSLFTVVFLFEDLPSRIKWHLKSSWREITAETDRYRRAYGSDPTWSQWLSQRKAFLDQMKVDWKITTEEQANPAIIPWWPTPGQMKRHNDTSQTRTDYLSYLDDWFYKELSSDSHLSWPGLAKRSMHFFNKDREHRDQDLDKFRSDCFTVTVALALAVLSEIQVELGYDLKERLKYIWGILNPGFLMVRELYEYRYEKLL